MSDSEELKSVVERLLCENNVKLKDSFQHVLPRIAEELWAARMIEKYVADGVHEPGVDHITLAAKVVRRVLHIVSPLPGSQIPPIY